METIIFAGIEGQVLESSPHGNYVVLRLTDRITICGTFSNIWNWEEIDNDSGFDSFITYIGLENVDEAAEVIANVAEAGGYFHKNEEQPRKAKRVSEYAFEIKVRGLSIEYLKKIIGFFRSISW